MAIGKFETRVIEKTIDEIRERNKRLREDNRKEMPPDEVLFSETWVIPNLEAIIGKNNEMRMVLKSHY